MNSRERLLITLNHREPDRVPVDPGEPPDPALTAFLAPPESCHAGDPLMTLASGDVRTVGLRWPWRLPDGSGNGKADSKDREARDRAPERDAPLRRITSARDIEKYPWPDPCDPSRYAGLKGSARRLREEGFAVVVRTPLNFISVAVALGGPGGFDAGPAPDFSFLEYLADRVLDIGLEMSRRLLEEVEEYADVVAFGEDLPGQAGAALSSNLYRRISRPRNRTIMRFLKEHAGEARVLYSSPCIAEPVLRDQAEMGVDACRLPRAFSGREETRSLKARYGGSLTFWGGMPSEERLSSGTPEEVKSEVRRRVEDLAPGGGFVFGSLQDFRPGAKPENLRALYEALLEYGTYR